ncbi:hypothetical protein I317_04615 [Kwoniella heveanensis CBS 569]|nr:hypothetical protein I317_04615 [Kwoniella heveanensis CBS 569]
MSAFPQYPFQQSEKGRPGEPSERSAGGSDDDGYDEKEAPQGGKANGSGAGNSNRACDYCHRMKMKCIGKENPPCNRCRQSKHPCTFDGPRKSKSSKVEDRLRLVEAQIGLMQGSINELLNLQRGAVARDQSTRIESAYTPSTSLSIDALFRPQADDKQPGNPPALKAARDDPSLAGNHHGHRPWDHQSAIAGPVSIASPAVSEDDVRVDPLRPAHAAAPMANMLHLAEAARLKADSHVARDDVANEAVTVTSASYDHLDASRPTKRARTRSGGVDHMVPAHGLLRERSKHLLGDPVDQQWCTEQQGKELFDLFFERCGVYMPCFDPDYDTWDSLRKRSPFAITTILAVAAKCREAGGELCQHSRMSTLFTPVSGIEIVQAMILLGSWGETFWRPVGHAIRIAMDLGLHKCLPSLVESGMGGGKPEHEIEEDRATVAGARVWLTVRALEGRWTSFAYGQPGLFCAEILLRDMRELLRHPLSLPTDARLVSSCESLLMRVPLHQPFALAPNNAAQPFPGMDAKLREVNRAISEWYEYWDSYYARNGVPKEHFLRETMITGAAGSFLGSNSYIIHGIRNRRDIARLTDERRHWLEEAGRRAHQLLSICLRGQQYTRNFQYGMYNFNIAYAARFLIRMATLMPEACNLKQIGKDVEQIAVVLTKVPGFQFAHFLQDVIKKARRDQVFPPPSRAPSRLASPAKALAQLPWDNMLPGSSGSDPWSNTLGSNASLLPSLAADDNSLGSQGLTSHDDFLYAEHLFANTGNVATPGQLLVGLQECFSVVRVGADLAAGLRLSTHRRLWLAQLSTRPSASTRGSLSLL